MHLNLRRDTKRSLEMLETQEYAQAQDAEDGRQREAQSKRRYIKMHDGTCHLKEFIAVPVVGTDPYGADTEAPNDQDERTNPIEDVDT